MNWVIEVKGDVVCRIGNVWSEKSKARCGYYDCCQGNEVHCSGNNEMLGLRFIAACKECNCKVTFINRTPYHYGKKATIPRSKWNRVCSGIYTQHAQVCGPRSILALRRLPERRGRFPGDEWNGRMVLVVTN
jgi:hypothetical protein